MILPGSALEALSGMTGLIAAHPKGFQSVEAAIEWQSVPDLGIIVNERMRLVLLSSSAYEAKRFATSNRRECRYHRSSDLALERTATLSQTTNLHSSGEPICPQLNLTGQVRSRPAHSITAESMLI